MIEAIEKFISQTVSLVGISLVIGIVLVTIVIGKQVENASSEKAATMIEDMTADYLKELEGKNTVIPTVTAYNIIETYKDSIISVECKICHKTTDLSVEESCLVSHLRGKVSLEVQKDESGLYKIIIHKENCTWLKGPCTCN